MKQSTMFEEETVEVEIKGHLVDKLKKEYWAEIAMSHGHVMSDDEITANIIRSNPDLVAQIGEDEKTQILNRHVLNTISSIRGKAKNQGVKLLGKIIQGKPVKRAFFMRCLFTVEAGKTVSACNCTRLVFNDAMNYFGAQAASRRAVDAAIYERFQQVNQMEFRLFDDLVNFEK